MRKNLSGKTEWATHTRNTALGKRGVNKRERQAPLPDEDQPAFKHKKKAKKERKPWKIEIKYSLPGLDWNGKWFRHDSYTTKAKRDTALAALNGKRRKYLEYRAVDPPEEE